MMAARAATLVVMFSVSSAFHITRCPSPRLRAAETGIDSVASDAITLASTAEDHDENQIGVRCRRIEIFASDQATVMANIQTCGKIRCGSILMSDAVGPLPAALDGKFPALRGPVANGFGRGSKKLGIPTANLPCSLFQDALSELPCGVYVGWAAIRGSVHKAVCNIGFSPTFAGEENPEKIVEVLALERDLPRRPTWSAASLN